MITGFNTDIEYAGVTYHIQTEDKGMATPLILSLVYHRGTILASKRSPYDDLLVGDFDENLLSERLKKQHKLMCAAVRAGRLEDLKRMTLKESESRKEGLVVPPEMNSVAETQTTFEPAAAVEEIPVPEVFEAKSKNFEPPETQESDFNETVWDIPLEIIEEPAQKFSESVEEEVILPSEAVEIITDLSKIEPTRRNQYRFVRRRDLQRRRA